MTPVSTLLKSCTTPPARRPTASHLCAWSWVSSMGALTLSPVARSDHGNGVAVFMHLLWRGTVPERNPTMGSLIPRCSRIGNVGVANRPTNRSQYRRTNLTLRRADVTQIRKSLWKTWQKACFLLHRGNNKH